MKKSNGFARYCALCAVGATGLLAATAIAASDYDKYVGDIAPESRGLHPTGLQFAVYEKKIDGRFVPRKVLNFKSRAVPMKCTDGKTIYSDDGFGENVSFFRHPASTVAIRKRRFSSSEQEGSTTSTISGQVPKKGPATGTVRLYGDYDWIGLPPTSCDSGDVAWTANSSG